MTPKTLDAKLARLHADPGRCRDFILADAKDADMALGVGAPGRSPEAHPGETRYRSLAEYREIIAQLVEQGLVDIMLMSASTNEVLAHQRRLFEDSPVTPAARVNDTTDIHVLRGGRSPREPSLPFRTTTIDHVQCGRLDCRPEDRWTNLGLYSITFNDDPALDRLALEEYKAFRIEAERKGFRHFLEVFDPNAALSLPTERIPEFVNDAIARTLGGVTSVGRPLFLKVVYHGPKAMEELVHYDPHLIVGILGGSAGTTYDAFKLLAEAKKYGARVALFGRKINHAENQLAFVRFLRLVADEQLSPEEAVRAYHGTLQRLGVPPQRSLEDDLKLQSNVMNYAGNGKTISVPQPLAASNVCTQSPAGGCGCGCKSNQTAISSAPSAKAPPDFARMTPAQKIAYHKARWDRILG
jgi:hypothetical protein